MRDVEVPKKRNQQITINTTTWSHSAHLTRGGHIIIIIIIKIIQLQYLSLPHCSASSLPPGWLFVVNYGVVFLLSRGKFVWKETKEGVLEKVV